MAQKFYELVDGEPGIGDDSPEGALPNLLVVRHDDTTVRLVAAKDHMAPLLAAEHKAGAFQGGPDLAPRKTRGELGHDCSYRPYPAGYAASTSTNSLPASVGTGSPASRQSSRYSSIASRIFANASARVSP